MTRVERSELLLMDESFSVRLNAHTDSDADGGSSDEEGTEEFSIISAQHIYYDWLQLLPKSDVKMMAMVTIRGGSRGGLWGLEHPPRSKFCFQRELTGVINSFSSAKTHYREPRHALL